MVIVGSRFEPESPDYEEMLASRSIRCSVGFIVVYKYVVITITLWKASRLF